MWVDSHINILYILNIFLYILNILFPHKHFIHSHVVIFLDVDNLLRMNLVYRWTFSAVYISSVVCMEARRLILYIFYLLNVYIRRYFIEFNRDRPVYIIFIYKF